MKRSLFLHLFILILWSGCEPISYDSEVHLPRLISDGMVIQRGEVVKIWGKGGPGEKIRVALAGTVASGTVKEDSTWKIELPEFEAGGPFQLQINKEIVSDVYIGEVWLAGGQSNMEWPLAAGVIGAEEEIASGGIESVRFFKVPKDYGIEKETDVSGGEWKIANPQNMPDFSAVAWFFAKRNHLEKEVPVGIIESNWGGTPAEGWTEAEALAKLSGAYSEEAQEIVESPELLGAEIEANEKRREIRDLLVQRPDSLAAREAASLDYNDTNWKRINLPADNPLEHIAWVRKKFSLNTKEGNTLVFPNVGQGSFVFLNGKLLHHHNEVGVGMPPIEIPSDLVNVGQNVLTIRTYNTWNNRPSVGAPDGMYIQSGTNKVSLEGSWTYSNDIVEPQLPNVEWLNWKPSLMYNAMIHPLINYGIRGVIWYQGESNAGRHDEYQELFSAMIQNWREKWELGDFPFLFVQLANWLERKELQPDSDWAHLREAQRQTLALPNTGMAVTIDIGEAEDIHPRNKKDVGERLWLQARTISFEEEILDQGPEVSNWERRPDGILLTFVSTGDGLQLESGEEVKGFIVSQDGESFELASAKILSENQVLIVVESPQNIQEIRYAWADNPEVNLQNHIGLPAVPFRLLLEEEKAD
ncbi:sialate O-acetylesterase [Algoriphagus sediminis]|uniref:Sialate O-acetylesterase n=1 Tax=Algoriphagus sediminis TaxID=3057113 RepID=A0ABT7YAP3_9BACT|nr:sialate O-acetylesterase [Algoriphagus sediminis]MDN3203573.1 sialate O-acetylesterase [Algoriphagus sediminis]